MMEAMKREARVRTPGHVWFTRRTLGEGLAAAGEGRTLDISEHGMRIESREPLYRGDLVRLDVMLDNERLEVDAWVARVGDGPPYEVGLRFEGITLADQAKIRGYVAEHRPRFGLGA